jgi:hypothetical protein
MKAEWMLAVLMVMVLLGGSVQVQGAVGNGAMQTSCAVDAFFLVEGDWQAAVQAIERRGGCVRDIFPPDVLLGSLPLWSVAPPGVQGLPAWQMGDVDFVVPWSGSDSLSGVVGYQVQVKVDDAAWTDWYSGTETSQVYSGQVGHRYAFRCRATDGAGNVETWPGSEDAFTELLHGLFLPGVLR